MNTAANTNDLPATETAASNSPEPDEVLDPTEAARLLHTTERRARQLTHQSPYLSAAGGVLMLGIYGGIWLSVRGQDPYVGPSLAVVGVVYLSIALFAMIAGSWRSYARAGVSGRSRREERQRAIPLGISIAGFYTFLGALNFDGFSHAVVYGVVDAAGPWIVAGAAFLGWAAAKEDWWKMSLGICMIAGGAASAFFGPENVWGLVGLLGCVMALGHAAAQVVWTRRA